MVWILGTALGSKARPAPSPRQANDFSLRKIRRTDADPLAMLKSQSFSADKGNQKPGIGGKRVMHAY